MIWRQHIHKVVLRLPDSWSNWNLEVLVFKDRGKPEYPEKTSRSKGRRQALSPLRHPLLPHFPDIPNLPSP